MTASDRWKDDVYKEKSLYDVYRASRVIEPSRFNVSCMRVCYVLCGLYVLMNVVTGADNGEIIAALSRISASLITITTAVLGFLIAGFSIFISSTPNRTLIMLLNTRYKSTEISYFKQIMFNFLNVFSVYLCVLVIALGVNTSTPLGWSPLLPLGFPPKLTIAFNSSVLGVLVISSAYAVLRLKSFIWTMYQGLIVNMMLGAK